MTHQNKNMTDLIRYTLETNITRKIEVKDYSLKQLEENKLSDLFDTTQYNILGRSRCTDLKDKNCIYAWEGDIRLWKGNQYHLLYDGWRFRFNRCMLHHGDNEMVNINEDNIFESELIGSIFY